MIEKEKYSTQKKVDFSNFTWPVILILSGITLLLNNLGIISWDVWNVIIKFWPLLLILAGLEYIIGNNVVGSLLSFFLAFLIILFVFVFSIASVNREFDNYIRGIYPNWSKIQNVVPRNSLRRQNFRCNPFDGNCFRYYNN